MKREHDAGGGETDQHQDAKRNRKPDARSKAGDQHTHKNVHLF